MKNKEIRESLNDYLKNYFNDKGNYNKIIYDSASYSLNIGGKRIRPILMILSYSMYKNNWKDILPVAAAMEMIHTYSLIHDDLPAMDNDDLRRGMPTNHKKYGEAIAILAGDTLLNEAMSLMMSFALKNGENALKAAIEIAEAAGPEGMIGGQVVDIVSEGKKVSKDVLNYMHLKKTGELIRASVVVGAMLAGANEDDKNKLNEFGQKLGLVFQIKDDILDVEGNVNKLGKNTLSDENNDKTNFISLYGLEYCKIECKKLTENCIDILKTLSVDASDLIKLTYELLDREY
ncbi:polyprenyl synthetase family protein [Clostridium sp. NSJ-49]|uniref:Farnesyl diphosphate synthase n=1 Tax=Clostridium disporicum TaxID=84024 RepID=A0A174GB76_9CLOT|nr:MULTISPECIES: farnesyl diphosphate synthase [Clostridium]MBC5625444.1 polyprenyl synthetase family protein [Clostridium sp. NSJ-49]MCD2500198.1 polyprenyl synthetase family protein [Clostridium sp. NSJ-145]MDU6340401.1 polyprenyl synthetase family protein [Clostridium sp.]CUO57725.1 polyprenyl synthetase [Clostridium disporicum]